MLKNIFSRLLAILFVLIALAIDWSFFRAYSQFNPKSVNPFIRMWVDGGWILHLLSVVAFTLLAAIALKCELSHPISKIESGEKRQ